MFFLLSFVRGAVFCAVLIDALVRVVGLVFRCEYFTRGTTVVLYQVCMLHLSLETLAFDFVILPVLSRYWFVWRWIVFLLILTLDSVAICCLCCCCALRSLPGFELSFFDSRFRKFYYCKSERCSVIVGCFTPEERFYRLFNLLCSLVGLPRDLWIVLNDFLWRATS